MKHVTNTASKASKLLGMARRNFRNCSKHVRETAYKTKVTPKLEYACEAWDPHYKKDIKTLQKVQRYRYVGHAWMEDIGREEDGIEINNDFQDKS
jgi:hypothetical protein